MTYYPSLDYFLAIARHKNITKAAQELHVSQQNLSIYLKRLEQYYQVTLFERKPRLKLTPAGEILLSEAMKIQEIQQNIQQQLEQFSAKKHLTVGCCRARIPYLMGFFHIPDYSSQHPDVEIHIVENNSVSLEQLLLSKQLDFFIGNNSALPPDTEAVPLGTYPYYVAVTETVFRKYFKEGATRLRQQWSQGVDLKEFASLPYIAAPFGHLYNCVAEYEREQGFSFRIAAEHTSPELRMQMCQNGLGFTISEMCQETLKEQGILLFPIQKPSMVLSLACIRRSGEKMLPYVEDLWRLATQNPHPLP